MGYTEAEGDLLALGLPAIGHGCNTAGSMVGGIAAQVQHRWPDLYTAYVERCATEDFALGGVFIWEADDVVVYNLATQVNPGRDARLVAVRKSVTRALTDVDGRGIGRLGVPRLGTGLGGLEWREVRRVLREVGWASPVELVVVRLPTP